MSNMIYISSMISTFFSQKWGRNSLLWCSWMLTQCFPTCWWQRYVTGPLVSFWDLHLPNKGIVIGMHRVTGPQSTIWMKLKGAWSREEVRQPFSWHEPWFKADTLPYGPLRATVYLSFLEFLFPPETFSSVLRTLTIFECFRHLENLEMLSLAEAMCPSYLVRPKHHQPSPALLRASGYVAPWEVLVRKAAAQVCCLTPHIHSFYASNFHTLESWHKLYINRAKIWLKAACISQELCASIPALSRGVMSSSLISALWKEQMVPRPYTLAPEFPRPLLAFIYVCNWGEGASLVNWCVQHG